jgi:hypothetical protein
MAKEARDWLTGLTDQVWTEEGGRFGKIVRAVVGSERSGSTMDALYEEIATRGPLFVLVESLDAVLPRPHATTSVQADGRHESAHRGIGIFVCLLAILAGVIVIST